MSLTKEEREWAMQEIALAMEKQNERCVDNERVADEEDGEEMKAFHLQKESGCCGRFDYLAKHPNGKLIWIGCNYGH